MAHKLKAVEFMGDTYLREKDIYSWLTDYAKQCDCDINVHQSVSDAIREIRDALHEEE